MFEFLRTSLSKLLGFEVTTQLFRFLIVGTISTIISYLAFLFFLRIVHFYYISANILAFCCSVFVGFYLNKKWSFVCDKNYKSQIFKYLSIYLFSLALNTAILRFSVDFLGIIAEFSFFIALAVSTITNFLGIKFLVFKK